MPSWRVISSVNDTMITNGIHWYDLPEHDSTNADSCGHESGVETIAAEFGHLGDNVSVKKP